MKNIKNKTTKLSIYLCISTIIICSIIPSKLFAIVDYDFYNANDILYYDPSDCVTTNGSLNLEGNEYVEKNLNYLVGKGLNIMQASAIAGNLQKESHNNPKVRQGDFDNGFPDGSATADSINTLVDNKTGFGIAQWTSRGRQQNLVDLAKSTNRTVIDQSLQLDYLWQELNGSYKAGFDSFKQKQTLKEATEFFEEFFERSADGADLIALRVQYAQEFYDKYKSTIKGSSSISSSSNICGEEDTTINATGSAIADIALSYALTPTVAEGKYNKSDARDTYQAAKEKYNPSVSWSDCGGFIATVMISSGKDTNFPTVYVPTQLSYAKNNTDKYKVIEKAEIGDLEPGDIMIKTNESHIMMYTGESDYPGVDASLHEDDGSVNGRVPSVFGKDKLQSVVNEGITIVRFIGK
ncbi:MAG: hypothetical protein PWQ10_672 [Patescibacteria group bacterium]|nr:hypothetical protein [Patescibacteria group bacterium]